MTQLEWSEDGKPALFAAHAKAQADMASVIKGAINPAFRSKYADLSSVLEAVLPALNKHGVALIQSPSFDGEVVTVETILVHEEGGWMRSALSLRPTKQDPQGVGSAVTYARRYALLAIAGVAPEDDDGNAASGPGQAGERFSAYPPPKAQMAASGIRRLSSAQAKERGLDKQINDAIDGCTTIAELAEWDAGFDRHTAECPAAWLDAIHNRVILRKEEILREQGEIAMDREYAEVVG